MKSPRPLCSTAELAALLLVVSVALVISGIGPKDAMTWLLEVLPVLIVAPVLILTRRRFPLTRLCYWFITLHALILILGGHYTYAEVPLGFWLQDALELARNPYDRIGADRFYETVGMATRSYIEDHNIDWTDWTERD